jgi:hypothetical protein
LAAPPGGHLSRRSHAQMPRHDSQMARGESAERFNEGGLATIHKTLSVRFLRHPFLSQSILPEIPEAGGRKLSVANCVLDVLVPEIVL